MNEKETDPNRRIDWLKGRVRELERTVAKLEMDSHPPADLRPAIHAEVERQLRERGLGLP